jgi:hypothetical protein
MLFIDTNDSGLEIATAEKAACERGERLVVVPKNYKEYAKFVQPVARAQNEINRCRNNCRAIEEKLENAYNQLDNFQVSQKSIQEATKEVLEELKKQNAKIQNFTISGHDGGGSYGGYKGNMSRSTLAEMMKDYGDINEAQSLLLLGCYTGVQKEIIEWKSIFPKARLIAGYDGSAPLSDKPLGHQYITEILLKEKELYSQADQKQLQNFTRTNIQSLFQLNSAMYVNCDPEAEKEFYFGAEGTKRRFTEFDAKECIKRNNEIHELTGKYERYLSGEQEPPKETNGELRQIYNVARTLEHCLEILESPLDVNRVFNLLFYDGVKNNFAIFYKDDLQKAQEIIDGLNIEAFDENTKKHFTHLESLIKEDEDTLALFLTSPDKFFAQQKKKIDELEKQKNELLEKYPFVNEWSSDLSPEQNKIMMDYSSLNWEIEDLSRELSFHQDNPHTVELDIRNRIEWKNSDLDKLRMSAEAIKQNPEELKKIWSPTRENLAKKSRKELLANLHQINFLLTTSGFDKTQTGALRWINAVASRHLNLLENPFSWHEFTPMAPEKPHNHLTLQDMLENDSRVY